MTYAADFGAGIATDLPSAIYLSIYIICKYIVYLFRSCNVKKRLSLEVTKMEEGQTNTFAPPALMPLTRLQQGAGCMVLCFSASLLIFWFFAFLVLSGFSGLVKHRKKTSTNPKRQKITYSTKIGWNPSQETLNRSTRPRIPKPSLEPSLNQP